MVSKTWVEENSQNLTSRDEGLLKIIHQKRYLKRDQIEILYPHFASTNVLNRRLKTLFEKHFIDRFYPSVRTGEGSSQQYVCLDRAGAVLFDLGPFRKPIRYGPEGERYLPQDWRHHSLIIDAECAIRKEFDVVLMEQEERRIFGRDRILIPDILTIVRVQNKGGAFFLEVDMGTEDIGIIREKVERYKQYYWSRAWMREKWVGLFKAPIFPSLIFLNNSSEQRREAIRRCTKESNLLVFVEPQEALPERMKYVIGVPE